ncbi:MAG: dockerin type I repeat-containing protein, partial [Muribaculaceae bacterium]|nr:dockerin type I repeat-containing protein [Muribaculaceae bacterium]
FAANPDDSKIYFLGGSCERWNVFVNSVDLFGKLNLGQAYLAVDKSLLGGDYTSPVQLDLWSAVPGDVNGDGTVDVTDVNIIINIMLGKANASQYPGNADVNGDGKVDVTDVNIIINIMLGKA